MIGAYRSRQDAHLQEDFMKKSMKIELSTVLPVSVFI